MSSIGQFPASFAQDDVFKIAARYLVKSLVFGGIGGYVVGFAVSSSGAGCTREAALILSWPVGGLCGSCAVHQINDVMSSNFELSIISAVGVFAGSFSGVILAVLVNEVMVNEETAGNAARYQSKPAQLLVGITAVGLVTYFLIEAWM